MTTAPRPSFEPCFSLTRFVLDVVLRAALGRHLAEVQLLVEYLRLLDSETKPLHLEMTVGNSDMGK